MTLGSLEIVWNKKSKIKNYKTEVTDDIGRNGQQQTVNSTKSRPIYFGNFTLFVEEIMIFSRSLLVDISVVGHFS